MMVGVGVGVGVGVVGTEGGRGGEMVGRCGPAIYRGGGLSTPTLYKGTPQSAT
jgi:hypothetical protein